MRSERIMGGDCERGLRGNERGYRGVQQLVIGSGEYVNTQVSVSTFYEH